MNNDLISRNKLKEDLIKFFPTDCLDGIESKTLFNQILHDIDNAPTVEERPTGRWIDKHHENRGNVCSFCNESLPCTDEYDYYTNFCPNCGADMRKGGNEE